MIGSDKSFVDLEMDLKKTTLKKIPMSIKQSMKRIHFLESNPVLIRQVLDPAVSQVGNPIGPIRNEQNYTSTLSL